MLQENALSSFHFPLEKKWKERAHNGNIRTGTLGKSLRNEDEVLDAMSK